MKKMKGLLALTAVLLLFASARCQTSCLYEPADYTWFCNGSDFHLNHFTDSFVPLNYTDFTTEVIVLQFNGMFGSIPNGTFSSFSARIAPSLPAIASNGIATISLPEPKLIFNCDDPYQTHILWDVDSFRGLEFIRRLEFIGCSFNQHPDYGLSPFNNLISLQMFGGTINNINSGFFLGLNVERDVDIPGSGNVYMSATFPLFPRIVPTDFFKPLSNATSLTLTGNSFRIISASYFTHFTKVRYLNFSDQNFYALPLAILKKFTALSSIRLVQWDWLCACVNLEPLSYFESNQISYEADFVCASPASEKGKHLTRFYEQNCGVLIAPEAGFAALKISWTVLSILFAIFPAVLIPIFIIPMWKNTIILCILGWGEEQAQPSPESDVDESDGEGDRDYPTSEEESYETDDEKDEEQEEEQLSATESEHMMTGAAGVVVVGKGIDRREPSPENSTDQLQQLSSDESYSEESSSDSDYTDSEPSDVDTQPTVSLSEVQPVTTTTNTLGEVDIMFRRRLYRKERRLRRRKRRALRKLRKRLFQPNMSDDLVARVYSQDLQKMLEQAERKAKQKRKEKKQLDPDELHRRKELRRMRREERKRIRKYRNKWERLSPERKEALGYTLGLPGQCIPLNPRTGKPFIQK